MCFFLVQSPVYCLKYDPGNGDLLLDWIANYKVQFIGLEWNEKTFQEVAKDRFEFDIESLKLTGNTPQSMSALPKKPIQTYMICSHSDFYFIMSWFWCKIFWWQLYGSVVYEHM